MKLPDESPTGMFEVLSRFVEELLASANGLVEVKSDRIRHSVRRTIVKIVLATGAALCVALWLGAASLATLRGLCGGFSELLGGREWLGDLCGGLLALALSAGVVALHLRLSRRRELIRLEAKYEHIRSETHTGDERGATARARGGPGDPAHQRGAAERG